MPIDFSSYTSIKNGLFVRIECPYYRVNSGDSYSNEILRFSDLINPVYIDTEEYLGLGRLLSITSSSSEIKATNNDLTITLSGIPNDSIGEILNSKIKGSSVEIYRGFFDASTGIVLNISGNPMSRYTGIINNFGLSEDYDSISRTSTNTITLMCSSFIDILGNTTKGRRTNPEDEKRFFPNDLSMDRVPNLATSNFNFGAPQ